MGNCQTSDAVSTLIEYPTGRVERLYWTISARQVMLQNPGYYVAVYIWPKASSSPKQKPRIKVLPPSAILVTGHYYRLVSFEEVLDNFSSRKNGARRLSTMADTSFLTPPESSKQLQVLSDKNADVAGMSARGMPGGNNNRQWRPSLQSISETSM